MKKIRALLLTVIAMGVLFFPFTVRAAAENVYIGDDANLLTSDEEEKLQDYLSTLNADYKYVVVTSETSDYGEDTDSRLAYYYDTKKILRSSYDDNHTGHSGGGFSGGGHSGHSGGFSGGGHSGGGHSF